MSDQFGGIAVDETEQDEFGGAALPELPEVDEEVKRRVLSPEEVLRLTKLPAPTYPGMTTMGPESREEVSALLGPIAAPLVTAVQEPTVRNIGLAPLRMAGAAVAPVAEAAGEVLKPAGDMFRDWLVRTGVDPSGEFLAPWMQFYGEHLGQPLPGTPFDPLKWAFPRVMPAIRKEAGQILGGLGTPEVAATLPLAPLKPVQALYLAGMLPGIPEAAERIAGARTREEVAAGGVSLLASTVMSELLRRGINRRPPETILERMLRERGIKLSPQQFAELDARIEKGFEQHAIQQEAGGAVRPVQPQPVEGAGQVPTEAGGAEAAPRGRALTEAEIAANAAKRQERVLLVQPALEANDVQGLPSDVLALDDLGKLDPYNRKPFVAQPAVVDADGNFVRPGKILMSVKAFDLWLEKIPEAQRPAQIAKALTEEGIHALVTPKEAAAYLKTLTAAEIAIGKRQYLRDVSEAEVQLNDVTLGHELFRQRMQRVMGMEPTEIGELAGIEKWSAVSVEMLARIIRRIREFVGTRAAKAGQAQVQAVLDRAQRNIESLRYEAAEREGMAMEGAGLATRAEVTPPLPAAAEGPLDLANQIEQAWRAGDITKAQDLAEQLPQSNHPRSNAIRLSALAEGDPYILIDLKIRGEPLWKWTRPTIDPSLKKPTETLEAAEASQAPFMLRRGRYTEEEAAALAEHLTAIDKTPGLSSQEIKRRTIQSRIQSGINPDDLIFRVSKMGGGVDYVQVDEMIPEVMAKHGIVGDTFSSNPTELRSYGLNVPTMQEILTLPTGRYTLTEINERLGRTAQPAMLRRPRKIEEAAAKETLPMFMPPGAAATPRPGPTEILGLKPLTNVELNAEALGYLKGKSRPDFETFTTEMKERFGQPLKPEDLRNTWGEAVWNHLLKASGKELTTLVRALNLAKTHKLELPSGELRTIADPPPEMKPRQRALIGAVPGVTRPHFVMMGRPMVAPQVGPSRVFGPYDVPFKGRATAESRAQFTPEQQFRARVIAAIGNKLLREAELGRRSWNRKQLDLEDIATPNPERQAQPVYQTFTTEDNLNPVRLGKTLTDDARAFGGAKIKIVRAGQPLSITQKGLPVTVTKRVTAIQNKLTEKVYLVSTYRHGRTGAMLLDPQAPGAVHRPLSSILARYRVIASVLLDEPVKDFRQEFKTLREYEQQFGREARAQAFGPLVGEELTGEEVAPAPGSWEVDAPITPAEAGSILDNILTEVGRFDSPDDLKLTLPLLSEVKNRAAVSALRKLASQIEKGNPNLSATELIDQLGKQIYENHVQSKTFEEFQRRTMAQGPAESREALEAGTPAAAAQAAIRARGVVQPPPVGVTPRAAETARELTMLRRLPPTVIPGQPVPRVRPPPVRPLGPSRPPPELLAGGYVPPPEPVTPRYLPPPMAKPTGRITVIPRRPRPERAFPRRGPAMLRREGMREKMPWLRQWVSLGKLGGFEYAVTLSAKSNYDHGLTFKTLEDAWKLAMGEAHEAIKGSEQAAELEPQFKEWANGPIPEWFKSLVSDRINPYQRKSFHAPAEWWRASDPNFREWAHDRLAKYRAEVDQTQRLLKQAEARRDDLPAVREAEIKGLKTLLKQYQEYVDMWLEQLEPAGEERAFPAMLSRQMRNAKDEIKAIGDEVIGLMKKAATTSQVTAARDAADNIGNNRGRQAETDVRYASVTTPRTRLRRAFTPWQYGDPRILASANAIVEAGAITPAGTIDQPLARAKIAAFKRDVQAGYQQAQALMRSPRFFERRLGNAWARNQENLMRELDDAEAMLGDARLADTAKRMRDIMEEQYNTEVLMGYDLDKDPNYLAHRYDARLWGQHSIFFLRSRILGTKFRSAKKFDTYYEASAAGPYIPVTRDGSAIVGHRVRQGMKMVLRDQWREGLKAITTPDGKPLAVDKAKADYVEIPMRGGKSLFVHEDFAGLINNLVARNPIQDWAFTRGALHLSQVLKHSLLLGDFFHLGRVTYYGASIMGRGFFNWRQGWSVLDIAERNIDEAVRKGIISQAEADWGRANVQFGRRTMTRRQLAEAFQARGLNVGKIQDALYKDLLTNLSPSAGPLARGVHALIDPTFGRYNRFLFDKVTRGLMLRSAVTEFERLSKARPDIRPDKLMSDISRDVNNYFGNIGRQGWLQSAWAQDLARIFWLAPQWVEGLIKKEAGFYTRATLGMGRRGAELAGFQPRTLRAGMPALGTLGRGIGRGLVAMMILTQAVNLITRRKPTWQNEEKGHKFDAYIPSFIPGEEGFWLSPMAIFNEITHDLYRISETKPLVWDAVTQIAGNKESPLLRALLIAKTGTGPTGMYLTTTGGRAAAVAQALAPIPITFGRYGQAGAHLLMPGTVPPNVPGAVQRQLFATAGVKIEPKPSDLQEIQQYAREFAKEKGKVEAMRFQPTEAPTYGKLRQSVRVGDDRGAWKTLGKLREQGRTDEQILKAMRQWAEGDFTWSKESEGEFQIWMQEQRPGLWSDAMAQKLVEYQKFLEMYANEPR